MRERLRDPEIAREISRLGNAAQGLGAGSRGSRLARFSARPRVVQAPTGDRLLPLRRIRDDLLAQLQGVADRCRQLLAAEPDAQALGALSRVILATLEDVRSALHAEASAGNDISYEERIARQYEARGLEVPPRLREYTGRSAQSPVPPPPLPKGG